MKVSKKIFIIFSMILLLIPDISLGKDIRLELERPVIPVLVKKQINPTIKATLIQTDNSPYTIREPHMELQDKCLICREVRICLILFLLQCTELIKTG